MTEETKVHPADPAPANAVWKKTGQWPKYLGMAGILLARHFPNNTEKTHLSNALEQSSSADFTLVFIVL